MNRLITEETNFCRVFRLPKSYPNGFCFSGGFPVKFVLVDWFYPIPQEDIWNNEIKSWGEYKKTLADFVSRKLYAQEGYQYLLITDFGESIIIDGKAKGE